MRLQRRLWQRPLQSSAVRTVSQRDGLGPTAGTVMDAARQLLSGSLGASGLKSTAGGASSPGFAVDIRRVQNDRRIAAAAVASTSSPTASPLGHHRATSSRLLGEITSQSGKLRLGGRAVPPGGLVTECHSDVENANSAAVVSSEEDRLLEDVAAGRTAVAAARVPACIFDVAQHLQRQRRHCTRADGLFLFQRCIQTIRIQWELPRLVHRPSALAAPSQLAACMQQQAINRRRCVASS